MDAWSTFEQALDTNGPRRVELLMQAEEELNGDDSVAACDRDVLLCCIASVGVGERFASVEEVIDPAREVASRCRSSWPLYHLAESAHAIGAHQQVLNALSEVGAGFFESCDLMWRSARCAELRAVAMTNLMCHPSEIETVVSEIAASYVEYGEQHDFAPPRDLVTALIDPRISLRGCLEILQRSLDLEMWLGPDVAVLVERALQRGPISDG